LLAVDLGIKTGLVLYGRDGRLRWYRSKNFGSAARLRRGIYGLLREIPELTRIVLEGGGSVADIWEREAGRRGIPVRRISAEDWRRMLFYPREMRSGVQAKQNAVEMARRVIEWSGASRPTSLRHDAAEAILVGLWGVVDAGWLGNVPPEVSVASPK